MDLEPEWSKPDATKLPASAGHGYVLDLSDVPQRPGLRFGQGLLKYGSVGTVDASYLVVLTTPDEWQGEWSEETRNITATHSSPDAKPLVRQELRLLGAGDRVTWLDQDVYKGIWQSNPPVQEARRLTHIVYQAKANDHSIVDEFLGWNTHINNLLTPKQGPGEPELVSTRATVWAGALLDGGRKRSVLHAADMLLKRLELPREPLNVLADPTSSHRLKAASLTPQGDRASHAEDKHDLAPAILRHLWEEFPTQRKLLRSWAVSVAAHSDVPEDDARIAVYTLLDLSKALHDNDIIDSIGSELAGRRLSLAVEALTSAALDPALGKYVRGRLYRWMLPKEPSPAMVDLVTRICGGELATHQPSIAMTRLARAAVHAPFLSAPMVEAFLHLAQINQAEVTKALETWLAEEPIKRHGLVAFLSLAATDEGAQLLLGMTGSQAGRQCFVRAWQQLLLDDVSRSTVDEQLDRWGAKVESGVLSFEQLVDLMADVYEPKIHRSSLRRFFARDPDFQDSFWGEVLEQAIVRSREREKASAE
ncbi:hypothetical protein K2224_37695 (plasmid) [Streptomyces sp. BHT-5-2]|uniref:hypothetical protein n=1 Tax=unclassified Streptomyces TaxID=2593676 RepID=UPI001C8E8279|nr:hypothetical protein [Streptomyces sp. BHT-5-2]QZL08772.1 hypothetical protein K2224_37695 [Streptomyces sp. BHT-5-2]